MMQPEVWYELYIKPRHLVLKSSVSLCKGNWSAHWQIHSNISNRLGPETTKKLVYIYPCSEMVALGHSQSLVERHYAHC